MLSKPKQFFWVVWTSFAIALSACSTQATSFNSQRAKVAESPLKPVTVDQNKLIAGQTLYVPIYSHIYHYNSKDNVMNLSAMLSIRNTDLTHRIILKSVRYYNTDGQLIRQEIDNPVELKPLASTSFFIPADDTEGGSGANYIVEWVAEKKVYDPVVEAIMINTSSSQGISFISPAKVLKEYTPQK
jgi:hypothetical protein